MRPERPSLFDWEPPHALARSGDPPTSKDAAASMALELPELLRAVFTVIREAGAHGATLDDLVAATGRDKVSVSPRPAQLRDLGLIRDSGRTRMGKSGRQQISWIEWS